jgi:hypothetical protein
MMINDSRSSTPPPPLAVTCQYKKIRGSGLCGARVSKAQQSVTYDGLILCSQHKCYVTAKKRSRLTQQPLSVVDSVNTTSSPPASLASSVADTTTLSRRHIAADEDRLSPLTYLPDAFFKSVYEGSKRCKSAAAWSPPSQPLLEDQPYYDTVAKADIMAAALHGAIFSSARSALLFLASRTSSEDGVSRSYIPCIASLCFRTPLMRALRLAREPVWWAELFELIALTALTTGKISYAAVSDDSEKVMVDWLNPAFETFSELASEKFETDEPSLVATVALGTASALFAWAPDSRGGATPRTIIRSIMDRIRQTTPQVSIDTVGAATSVVAVAISIISHTMIRWTSCEDLAEIMLSAAGRICCGSPLPTKSLAATSSREAATFREAAVLLALDTLVANSLQEDVYIALLMPSSRSDERGGNLSYLFLHGGLYVIKVAAAFLASLLEDEDEEESLSFICRNLTNFQVCGILLAAHMILREELFSAAAVPLSTENDDDVALFCDAICEASTRRIRAAAAAPTTRRYLQLAQPGCRHPAKKIGKMLALWLADSNTATYRLCSSTISVTGRRGLETGRWSFDRRAVYSTVHLAACILSPSSPPFPTLSVAEFLDSRIQGSIYSEPEMCLTDENFSGYRARSVRVMDAIQKCNAFRRKMMRISDHKIQIETADERPV